MYKLKIEVPYADPKNILSPFIPRIGERIMGLGIIPAPGLGVITDIRYEYREMRGDPQFDGEMAPTIIVVTS